MAEFDIHFDRELNAKTIYDIQKLRGCFECGKGRIIDEEAAPEAALRPAAFPTRLCSRCRVARYCGVECQKLNWKPEHKHLCNTYCENSEDNAFSTLENLCGSHWLHKETSLVPLIRKRQELFFRAIQKYGISSGRPVMLEAAASAIEQLDQVHLVISVNFWPTTTPSATNSFEKPHGVARVLLECIDEGPAAIEDINLEKGILSPAALDQAIQHLLAFVQKCCRPESHCGISVMKLGRGLAPKWEEIETKLEGVLISRQEGYAPSLAESFEAMAMNAFLEAYVGE